MFDTKSTNDYNAIIMQRKLIKVGTSAAVLVPKEVLEAEGVKIGDMIHVEFSSTQKGSATIDPEVIQWTDEFIAEYRPLLEKLTNS